MPPLRPLQWLLYSPVAVLPVLAALYVQRPPEGRLGGGFNMHDYALLLTHHWFWLVFTAGLGVWVGWYTAIERPPPDQPEEGQDAP
jgi:hypothetical protein